MKARRELTDWERPSERYLAYLDRLVEACIARNREALDTLLRLRLSSHLPRAVLDEAEFFRRARAETQRAPIRLLRLTHQMRQLAAAAADTLQLRLALRAASRPAPPEKTSVLRRAARRR